MKKAIINGKEFDINEFSQSYCTYNAIKTYAGKDFYQLVKTLAKMSGGTANGKHTPVVDLDSNVFYPCASLTVTQKQNRALSRFVSRHVRSSADSGCPYNPHNPQTLEDEDSCVGKNGEDINGHYFVFASCCPYDYLKELYIDLVTSKNYKTFQNREEKKEESNSEIPAVVPPISNPNYDEKGIREINYLLENMKILKNSMNFVAGALNTNRKLDDVRHAIADISKLCIEIPRQIDFIDSHKIIISKEISLTEKDIAQLRKLIGEKDAENVLNLFGINWE